MISRSDQWLGREPRPWQRAALPVCLDALATDKRGVVHAVMGAGKSLLLSEIVAALPDRRVLITAPSIALVDQLHATVSARVGWSVGRVYTLRFEPRQITIVCAPSVRRLLAFTRDWDVWIADEMHRTECDSLPADDLPPVRLGFSATPYTGDGRGTLSAFDAEIVRYDADAAIRDGVIVPPRVYPYMGGADVPDDAPGDVALDIVCRHMLERHRPQGPGIINASSKAEAESVARWLTSIGWPAEAIHSGHHDRAARIAALERGDLRCLVHVALLVEGVDLPWLRWHLGRRKIASRVRFAQEAGRVLRAHPGKTHAVFLDPHDLFAAHDLAGEARLGELLRAAEGQAVATGSGERAEADPERLRPETVEGAIATLRHAHRTLVARGVLDKRPARRWHRYTATSKQAAAIRRFAWAVERIPEGPWRTGIARCMELNLTRGDAARLIDVLLYLVRRRV